MKLKRVLTMVLVSIIILSHSTHIIASDDSSEMSAERHHHQHHGKTQPLGMPFDIQIGRALNLISIGGLAAECAYGVKTLYSGLKKDNKTRSARLLVMSLAAIGAIHYAHSFYRQYKELRVSHLKKQKDLEIDDRSAVSKKTKSEFSKVRDWDVFLGVVGILGVLAMQQHKKMKKSFGLNAMAGLFILEKITSLYVCYQE